VWDYFKDTHYYETIFAAGFSIATASNNKDGVKILTELFNIADSRLDFLAKYKE